MENSIRDRAGHGRGDRRADRAAGARAAPTRTPPDGCKALRALYGMGELTSLVTLCELGDVARLSASRKAVPMAGIDIGAHRWDRRARRQAGASRPQSPESASTLTTSRRSP